MGADLTLELVLLPVCLAFGLWLGVSADAETRADQESVVSAAWRRVHVLFLLEATAVGALAIGLGLWWSQASLVVYFVVQVVTNLGLAVLSLRNARRSQAWTTGVLAGVWLVTSIPIILIDPSGGADSANPTRLGDSSGSIAALVILCPTVLLLASSVADSRLPHSWRHPDHLGLRTKLAVLVALASCCLVAWPIARTAAALTAGRCAPQWLVDSDPYLCVHATVETDRLHVSVDTTLPDGAIILLERGQFLLVNDPDATPLAVRDGKIDALVDMAGFSTFRLVFRVRPWVPLPEDDDYLVLGSSDQPTSVADRYHADGSGIVGLDAAEYGGSWFLHSADLMRAIVIELPVQSGVVDINAG